MRNNTFCNPVRSKLALSIAAVVAIGSGINSTAAYAQEEETTLEEITVTGSRIRRSNDFNNPQPTTVVGGEMLENLGLVNLGDAMAGLPSNVGNNTPTANPGSSFFNGSNIANLRGLNPFFGSRTLTLVDSRRHVPTNQGDGVDLNFIPSILIDRMEVVTGGASASYGSGAIGGVTNILMDRDLEGGKVQVDFGTTAEGDGDDFHYGLAWGSQIGDAGHFVIGIEGQEMDAIENCASARDWCASSAQIVTNADFANNELPNFVNQYNARTDNLSSTGVFPLLGLSFNDAGTATQPFAANGPLSTGGDGPSPYKYTALRSNIDRQVVYMNYDHQLNDEMGFFIEGSFGSVETYSPQRNGGDLNFGGPLAPDNYYLNQLDSNPCAGFPGPCFINKRFDEQANTANETTTDLARFAFGLDGRFGSSTWTWEAYYQHGKTERQQAVYDNIHSARFNFALDAIDDGNGNPVCRVSVEGVNPATRLDPRLAEGCVPINIFGTTNITPEAFAYSWGRLVENTDVEQDIVEAVTSGELFQGFGAGPVLAAFGASIRQESIDNISDPSQPPYIRRDYVVQYGETFGGEVDVLEYFAEVDVPITDAFNIQGAIRRSEYENTAGIGTGIEGQSFEYGITTWKINGNWQVNDLLALRVSQSRDIRAPNFRELYYGQVIPEGSIFGYCDNPWTGNRFEGFFTFTGDTCTQDLHGGLDIVPEEADTSTLGVILTPQDLNVRFAADFYRIKIEDSIQAASSPLTIEACFNRDPEACGLIQGTLLDPNDPLGGFSKIDVISPVGFNAAGYDVKGIDFTADWVGDFSFGSVSSRVIASRMIEQLVTPSVAAPGLQRDVAGVTGSTNGFLADFAAAPDWTAQWITTFSNGPLTLTTQARFVAEGKVYADRTGPQDSGYDPNVADSISDNRLPNYVVWALNGSYNFDVGQTQMEVFGSVQNLFDKEPPLGAGGTGGTNPTFYDTIGRNYRVGLRATF